MKRSVVFVIFFLILGFALAGLYWSQRRPKSTPVSANAILNMAADAQRDLSRAPCTSRASPTNEKSTSARNLLPATQRKRASSLLKRRPREVRRRVEVPWRPRASAFAVTFTVLPDHK